MKNKHAYLIIAHQEFEVLERFLRSLDSDYNDFYIHIDKKVKSFDFNKFKNVCKKSNINFIKNRTKIQWGGVSQIVCELKLMQECYKKNYSYVHLCSGVDLPLKDKNDIYNFFENHKGKQFLELLTQHGYAFDRLKYMNLFSDTKYKNSEFANRINRFVDRIQNHFKLYNKISYRKIVKTSNWFSLTGEAIDYICEHKNEIKKLFKHSHCGDELFVGTVLYGTKFWDEVYTKESHTHGNMRYIKWTQDFKNAKVLTMEDYDEIKKSECLFGRKFSFSVDREIIEKFNNIR